MKRQLRVLVEHPSGVVLMDHAEHLRDAGFEVTTCHGPGGPTDRSCPLVDGGRCDLVDEADVVVNGLGLEHADVYAAERVVKPETPVCLLLSETDATRLRGVVDHVAAQPTLTGGDHLCAQIADVLERRAKRD